MVFNIWKVGGLYEPFPITNSHQPLPAATAPVTPVHPVERDFLKNYAIRDEEKNKNTKESFKSVEWSFKEDWVAGQFMNFPVTALKADSTLKEAWEIVVKKRYRHIPVVNEQNVLIGILSDRDVLKKAALLEKKGEHFIGSVPVSEAMSYPVLAAEAHTLLHHVGEILLRKRIGCMPITDKEGHLIGILTRSDLLRAIIGVKREKFLT